MDKHFTLSSVIKSVVDKGNTVTITGLASTVQTDRVGDIIKSEAWSNGGLDNYNKNPIILFNHNYNEPIGKAIKLSVTEQGLEITAEISKVTSNSAYDLIVGGVLKTFSVGFIVKDAEYLKETGGLLITAAELIEVSVVSIPANAGAIFDVVKSFSDKEFELYRKGLTVPTLPEVGNKEDESSSKENKTMNPEEIAKLVAKTAADTAAAVKMAFAEEAAVAKKAAEDESTRVKAAADNLDIAVKAGASGAEKLLAEVTKTFAEKFAAHEEVTKTKMTELEAALRTSSDDLKAHRDSKRNFTAGGEVDVEKAFGADLRDAYLLNAVIKGRGGFEGTKFGKAILEKATNAMSSAAAPSASSIEVFENTVSTSIERDIYNGLILAPLFREIAMKTATMTMPIMPDAGYAEFVATKTYANTGLDAPEGSLSERGDTVGSPYGGVDLTSKTISTKKLMSLSYLANETEEDTMLAILPLINETMVRAHQRSVEHAMLLGGHTQGVLTGSFDGICEQARDNSKETQSVTAQATDKLTAANLLTLRRAMGKWAIKPTDIIYIVSQTGYFDLLEDPEFQDMNLVGSQAVKLSGEIGNVYGTRVLLCDEFPAAAVSKLFAAAVNPRNFIVPRIRGVTLESDYVPRYQHRELVATQRLGMESIITAGTSAATYKYKGS